MKIIGIVQARMGSTRLPGKVLKEVDGKPLLMYQIERMKESRLLTDLVIATTPVSNEAIIELCQRNNINYFVGSEEDVLARYYKAAVENKADIVVRMTSDCPIIDPIIIDEIIQYYIDNNYDYVSNTQVRTFPRGMDVEVFSMAALKQAFSMAKKDYEREHVTPYLYLNPDKFKIGQVTLANDDYGHIRLTVDTQEDFNLISILISDLYKKNPLFNLEMILEKLKFEPELLEINAHIEQKKLGE